MTGTDLTTQSRAVGLPREISTSLATLDDDWNVNRALYQVQQLGISEHTLAAYAVDLASSLTPVQHNRLVDRLTALGMLLAPNRAPAEASVWVRETARLLGDLPEDILGAAIDAAILEKNFLPTVAELRAAAEPQMRRRRREVRRLNEMSALAMSGVVIRKVEPKQAEPPRALANHGPPPSDRPRNSTRQDYLDMGVDPDVLDSVKAEDNRAIATG